MKREIHCEHKLVIVECKVCYPVFLAKTTTGDVLENRVYGKSQEWRDGADSLLEALARDNQYVVADMVQIFLESAGYGLNDYSPLGGVFKRAAKRGIISRIGRPTNQALWLSKIYKREA
jgi:hypothetical protein